MSARLPLAVVLLFSCSAARPAKPPESPPMPRAAESAPAPTAEARPTEAQPPPAQHVEGHAHGFHKDFSDAHGFARHFDDPAREAWQKPAEVIQHLRITPGQVVVDLGAGTGYFLPGLSQAVGPNGQVLALDVEPKMVEFMQERVREQRLTNVTPRLVAPGDPGLAKSSVARVLIVNTWHHLDRRIEYARKLADALAPGGEVWVVDFTPESDLGPPQKHRLPAERVVEELTGGGLRAEVVKPEELPKQYVVRASRGCATCKAGQNAGAPGSR